MPQRTLLLALICALLAAAPAHAADPTLKEVTCGVYEARIISTAPDQGYATKRTVTDVVFTKVTDRIPAQVGIRYGCTLELAGDEKQYEITNKELFPSLVTTASTGKSASFTESTRTYAPGRYTWGSGLVEPSELVPGRYRMQWFCRGKMLFEKVFTLYLP